MNATLIASGAVICSVASSIYLDSSCHSRCDARAAPTSKQFENCMRECVIGHKPMNKARPDEDRLFKDHFYEKRYLIRKIMNKENN